MPTGALLVLSPLRCVVAVLVCSPVSLVDALDLCSKRLLFWIDPLDVCCSLPLAPWSWWTLDLVHCLLRLLMDPVTSLSSICCA